MSAPPAPAPTTAVLRRRGGRPRKYADTAIAQEANRTKQREQRNRQPTQFALSRATGSTCKGYTRFPYLIRYYYSIISRLI